jgi:hypothetical protein
MHLINCYIIDGGIVPRPQANQTRLFNGGEKNVTKVKNCPV